MEVIAKLPDEAAEAPEGAPLPHLTVTYHTDVGGGEGSGSGVGQITEAMGLDVKRICKEFNAKDTHFEFHADGTVSKEIIEVRKQICEATRLPHRSTDNGGIGRGHVSSRITAALVDGRWRFPLKLEVVMREVPRVPENDKLHYVLANGGLSAKDRVQAYSAAIAVASAEEPVTAENAKGIRGVGKVRAEIIRDVLRALRDT